jgi:hypothetical protein
MPPTGRAAAYHRSVPVQTTRDEEPPGTAVFLPGPAHSPHRHRDLRRHRWARGVSTGGQLAIYLVLPVLAYQVSGSAGWTALAVVAGYLPHLAGRLVLDAVAGRPDRRRLLVAADAANAALLASLPVAFSLDALTAAHVVVVAFLAQVLFICFDAANIGTGPVRTSRDRLGKPFFTGGSAALLTVPVLAGLLLLVTAVPPLLTVDGVSLIVSLLLIRAIATPAQAATASRPPQPPLGAQLRQRVAVPLGRPVDRAYVLVCGLHAAAGGAFLGQFAPWLDQDLGVPPLRDVRFGLLLASWAVGARLAPAVLPRVAARLDRAGLLPPATAERLVSTGVLPRVTADRLAAGGAMARAAHLARPVEALGRVIDRLGGYRVTLVVLPISALCLLACALVPYWLVAAVLLVAWGAAYMVVVLDARVTDSAVLRLAFGLGWPAGAVAGGLVAAAAGGRAGLVSGVLLIVVATLVGWLSPLRTADRARAVPDAA